MQIWPPIIDIPSTLTRQVWDGASARTLPGVGRALSLYGLLAQCPMDDYRGVQPLRRPSLLERPDPDHSRPWFVRAHVEDYLLHGNACHVITAFDAEARPAATRWFPAHQWSLVEVEGRTGYYLNGRWVDPGLVVHTQRGADPTFPGRGIGVVEQHVKALNRVGLQEAAEGENLRGRGMPGVAIITPQKEPKESDLDAAADKWVERFQDTQRNMPAFLPAGSTITPLAWSPHDQEMTEARKLSLIDVANIFNLDPYWLGAPGSSHTYKSPGPLFLSLLRTSLEGVAVELEDVWSWAWLPRGRRVRFDRSALTVDDLETSIRTAAAARNARLWTYEESRAYLGMDPNTPEPEPAAVEVPAAPEPDPEPDPETEEIDA